MFLVEDGTRAVDPDRWPESKAEIEGRGVRVVSLSDPEVRRLVAH